MQVVGCTKKRISCFVIMLCLIMLPIMSAFAESGVVSVALPVRQSITVDENSSYAKESVFNYILKGEEPQNPMPSGSEAAGYAFTIEGEKEITIPPIEVSAEGTYRYRVYQVITDEKAGYLYDREIYIITITAIRNAAGNLIVETIAKNSNGEKVAVLDFTNEYKAKATDINLMTNPKVKKKIVGTPANKETFEFVLKAQKATNPMPQGSQNGVKKVTIVGEGEEEIGVWSYDKVGTYQYTVSEVNSGLKDYAYDESVYTITDVVRDDNGQLILSRTVEDNSGNIAENCEFTNTYKNGSGQSSAGGGQPSTGDKTNIALWGVLSVISMFGIMGVFVLKKKTTEKTEKEI